MSASRAITLLALGAAWLVLAALDYSYELCNPSGSGCGAPVVQDFGNFAPLIFAPGVFLVIAGVYLLAKGRSRSPLPKVA